MVADDRGCVGVDDTPAMIDHHESGVDADGGEHRREQRGLVLAVAVVIAEDIAGGVWLVAADAHFDDEVADLILDELGDGLGFVVEVGGVARELLCFGGGFG